MSCADTMILVITTTYNYNWFQLQILCSLIENKIQVVVTLYSRFDVLTSVFSWWVQLSHLFKGTMSRIGRLLFVNTTFKVGPSSPAQSCMRFWWTHMLTMWLLRFYRVPPCVCVCVCMCVCVCEREREREEACPSDEWACAWTQFYTLIVVSPIHF